MRALVVDISRLRSAILSRHLRTAGFRVAQVSNGLSAVHVLNDGPAVDLVCLTPQLPVLDGIALLRYIRASPALGRLPVLVVTSDVDVDSDALRALAAGADAFLASPVRRAEVSARAAQLGLIVPTQRDFRY